MGGERAATSGRKKTPAHGGMRKKGGEKVSGKQLSSTTSSTMKKGEQEGKGIPHASKVLEGKKPPRRHKRGRKQLH